MENPRVETSNWTVSPFPSRLVQFKLSPFGFSNAGLADFKFLLLPPEPLYLAVPLSNVATVPHMTENDEP